jgi:hypothetical protein
MESLADLYISRGETYLLYGAFEQALEDLKYAWDVIAFLSYDATTKKQLEFRALLNFAFIYALTSEEAALFEVGNRLLFIVDHLCLSRCSKASTASTLRNGLEIVLCGGAKILGPDVEPRPGWCREVVISTATLMLALASTAPNAIIRTALLGIIGVLQDKALRCCEAGGLWKVCVGPIAEKWQQWNQKWKVLHISPDPAWD